MNATEKPANGEQPNDIVHKQARQQEQTQVTPRDLGEPSDESKPKQPNRQVD